MIIRSRWRRVGGVAAHLDRTDTNESNREREDLCRDCPSGTAVALTLFSAIARTNVRATRALIHVKISPSSLLSNAQIARVIALFEAEHAIPETLPRYVREHLRGDRPPHFHVVYPVIDPETGRAIRSHRNYLNDEIASRLAELELGEAIVPGPRQDDVVRALRDREQHDAADLLARHQPAKRGDRVDDASRQQAVGLELDVDKIKNVVAEAWEQARGNEAAFTDRLKTRHLSIATGSKALLVVDEATGSYVPLARTLRQRAKERGGPERVRERDLQLLLGARQPFDHARSEGLRREEERAARAADDEMDRMAVEADLDDQRDLAERLRRAAADRRTRKREAFRKSLGERRRAIAAEYARRDRVRRARVVRAARVAEMLGTRDLRRIGMLVAGSVVLAGGGLGLALVAAGLAVAILPTRERVRALALEARLEKAQDRDGRERAMAAAYHAVEIEFGAGRTGTLRFSDIPKQHRVLAGAFANLTLASTERPLDPKRDMILQAAARVLGPAAPGIEALIFGRGGRAGLAVCGWYDPRTPRLQKALKAAFLAAGEGNAAAAVGERGTRKPGSAKDRAFGREL